MKVKLTVKDKKIKELQGTRDLFGRLLYLAATNEIDLEMVFEYPLTPMPLSLAHIDGSINKTDKAKLMHKLEEKVESDKPPTVDACVIVAMFLIRTLTNVPATFGQLAILILNKVLDYAARVDFVCDRYESPSIKGIEHELHGSHQAEAEFNITGPDQKLSSNFSTFKQIQNSFA